MKPTIEEIKQVTRPPGLEDFVARFVYRFFSVRFTKYLVRTVLTPNQITIISLLLGLTAAFLFSFGSSLYLKLGAIALFLYSILDCVDGEIARLKHLESEFGKLLDSLVGIFKDVFVVLGLCFGLYRQTYDISAWVFGFLVLFTMTMLNNVLLLSRSILSHSVTHSIAVQARTNLRKKIKQIFKIDIEPAYLMFGGETQGFILILGAFLNRIHLAFLAIIILGNAFWILKLFLIWGKRTSQKID